METSIIIKSKNLSNKEVTKSITEINPEATENILYNFATEFNALSTNTFQEVTRIDKTTLTGGNA